MKDYLLLMHNDVPPDASSAADSAEAWTRYLATLRTSGRFEGGSVIGDGACVRKDGAAHAITPHLGGCIKVRAASLDEARGFLAGNPVFELGGTVEIRELPES